MAIEAAGGLTSEEHFDAAAFDAELNAHGAPARWRKARLCPCLNLLTGAPDPNCPYCRTYPGLLWDDAGELRVLAPARRRQDLYDQNGHLLKGMVTLTFPSTVLPAHLDQIELSAAVMVVNNERHVRGEIDPAGRSTERLRLPTPLDVEYCEAIVAGVLTQYVLNTDFGLSDTNALQWAAGDAGPPPGTLYTIRYTARPVYICWSPESRDENGSKQPYRCIAQRLDYFRQPVVE
jgi:hypothetical protein